MNREEASNIWQIIKAYGEGKTIEWNDCGTWRECFIFDMDLEELESSNVEHRIKPEENCTIEQNCGENRVEGGVLSISGSVSKKQYKPFNNCDELIAFWNTKTIDPISNVTYNNVTGHLFMPEIWVKHKHYGTANLITAFDNDTESIGGSCVFIQDMWCDMAELFEQYTFLDGSPCGVEE